MASPEPNKPSGLGLSAVERQEWFGRLKDFSETKGLKQSDADIWALMDDSLSRGKSMPELMRRLEKRYGAVDSSRPKTPLRTTSQTSLGAGRSPQIPDVTAGKPAAQPAPTQTTQHDERARWRSLLLDFCDHEGLGQTESDIEDLLIEADKHGIAYPQVYEKLAKRFRGHRAAAAALESAAGGIQVSSNVGAIPTESALRKDPHFHRIARLLHFHRAFVTRHEAEINAIERLLASSKEGSLSPGAEVLSRVKSIYGEEPPASWIPPSDEERAALLASSAVLKAQAEALEAASAAKVVSPLDKPAQEGGDRKRSAAVSVVSEPKHSAARKSRLAEEATSLFPDDAEAQSYFLRIHHYCKHHRLGQTSQDIATLIREQRARDKPLERIIKRLVERFGEEPPASPELADVQREQDREQHYRRVSRLLQFYQMTPDPKDVNEILDNCDARGREYGYAIAKLVSKYGPEPPPDWVGAPLVTSQGPDVKSQPRARSATSRAQPRRAASDLRTSSRLGDDAPLPPTAAEPLTMRALAFSRLKRYALHNGWKRTDEDLHKMLDDAEMRSGGYEAMFARLVKSFGPEPRGPGITADLLADPEVERLAALDKLAVFCAHYGLKKTEKDMQKLLSDYELIGWPQMFRRLEGKFGPAPWRDERSPAGGDATHNPADAHWTAGGHAPSPEYIMDDITAKRRESLRQYSTHYRLSWTDEFIMSMVERHSYDFAALLSALERKHGPMPQSARDVVDVRLGIDGIRADASSTVAARAREGGALSLQGGGAQSAIAPHAPFAKPLPLPPPALYGAEDMERFRSEYAFWMQRVRMLFELHNPAYANEEDVDELLRHYVTRGVAFERMWSELIAKYGPEGPNLGSDNARKYWKGKFKIYCDHYKIKKTDAELEAMMDDFKTKGWARMYDRLVELHGPPPALPPTTAIRGIKMTPAQWRERLRNYCRNKFPTKSADEIDLYLDQFAEMNQGNLEALYATLVLLHGLENRDASSDATHVEQKAANQTASVATHKADAGAPLTKMTRDIAPPSTDFFKNKSLVRVYLTVSGFDAALYRGASAAQRQHLCTSVEQQLARCLGLGDNQCYVQALVPDTASVATFDVIVSPPPSADVAALSSTLVNLVTESSFSLDFVKRSYMEDLNGNPFALRCKDVTVSEVQSTALPDRAMSLDELRRPSSTTLISHAASASPVGAQTSSPPFAVHRGAEADAPAHSISTPVVTRAAQGLRTTSNLDRYSQPNFAEVALPADTPKPSRIKEILSVIGDRSSAEAIQRDAELSLRAQPYNGEGPFVRRSAPVASVDLTRVENPLARLSDGAATSAMHLPFSMLHEKGPLYHGPSYDDEFQTTVQPSATAATQAQWAAYPRYPTPAMQPPGPTTYASPSPAATNPLAFLTPNPSPIAGRSQAAAESVGGYDTTSVVSRVSSAAYAMRRHRIASGSPLQ